MSLIIALILEGNFPVITKFRTDSRCVFFLDLIMGKASKMPHHCGRTLTRSKVDRVKGSTD